MPQGYPSYGVLDTMSGVPPRKPQPRNPYNHSIVQKTVDLIQQFPGLDASAIQYAMQTALGQAQGQIDTAQQNRSAATNLIASSAQQGTSMEGTQALLNTLYPQLASKPFVSNALDQLYPGGGSSVLTTAASDPNTLSPDEEQGIASNMVTDFQGVQKTNAGQPITADQARTLITQAAQDAISAGKSPTGVEAARTKAKQVLAQLTHMTPAELDTLINPSGSTTLPVTTPPSAIPAGVLDAFARGWTTQHLATIASPDKANLPIWQQIAQS